MSAACYKHGGKLFLGKFAEMLKNCGITCIYRDLGVKRFAYALFGACKLKGFHHIVAQVEELLPFFRALKFIFGDRGGELIEVHARLIVTGGMRHRLPDLLGSKCKHRCDNAVKSIYDAVHCALCRAARGRVAFFDINAVFGDVDIQLGHIDCAEVVYRVVYKVELICVVPVARGRDKRIEAGKRPTIDVKKLVDGHEVTVGIEIAEVRHDYTRSVADLAVCLRKLLEDVVGSAHIDGIVTGSDPETNKVGTVFFYHFIGRYRISERFVHLLAFAVNDPSVSQNGFVRCSLLLCTDCGEKRRLEPTAVLVCTLKVHIRRPLELVVALKHRKVR